MYVLLFSNTKWDLKDNDICRLCHPISNINLYYNDIWKDIFTFSQNQE